MRLAFRFVDWLLRLPDELRTQFAQELRTFEEERQMTYITSIEELGIEKGRIEGLIEGIAGMLDLKFGDAAQPIIAEIREIGELGILEQILARIKTAPTLDDVVESIDCRSVAKLRSRTNRPWHPSGCQGLFIGNEQCAQQKAVPNQRASAEKR